MPSAPELLNRTGQVWIIKVFTNIESEHFAQTDGHIRETGKIIVNLNRIQNRRAPHHNARNICNVLRIDLIYTCADNVCDQHLFTKSIGKAPNSLRCLFHGFLSACQLRGKIAIPRNRSD